MKLYFIRHGENQANLDKIISYKLIDFSLTPRGVEQAQYLAEWLRDRHITNVYSSPLKRAVQTAEIVIQRLNLSKVCLLEDLREINVGKLDGKYDVVSWQIHDSIINQWIAGKPEIAFEGGEDHYKVQKRLKQAVAQILDENSNLQDTQGIAIVAHLGILFNGLPWLCNNLNNVQAQQGMKNTAITIVEVNNNQLTCLQWGICNHLSPSLREFK